jgi:hypothetical protein
MAESVINENQAAPAVDADAVAEASDASAAGKTAKQPRSLRLARLLAIQGLTFLVLLSLFAAADSWSVVTGLGLATLLCMLTGLLGGVGMTTLIHEWFHLLGARFTGGQYAIPSRLGLFLFDWDFEANSLRQFFTMSVAGSIGGALSLLFLYLTIPMDSWGRAALYGGAVAGFVFAAVIEWPVLRRCQAGADPITELSKIDQALLTRSFIKASVAALITTVFLAP